MPRRLALILDLQVVRHQARRVLCISPKTEAHLPGESDLHLLPDLVVLAAQRLNNFRVGTGYVFRLRGIRLDLIEFLAIDQAPTVAHDRRLAPFLGHLDSLRVRHQNPVPEHCLVAL